MRLRYILSGILGFFMGFLLETTILTYMVAFIGAAIISISADYLPFKYVKIFNRKILL